MPAGFLMQVVVPVPSGSNPLWLEKNQGGNKLLKFVSILGIVVLFAASVIVISDYKSVKDPNASECNMGFSKTGCPDGYKCVGGIVGCEETNKTYKYRLTAMVFPEKKCKAAQEYREYCVADNATAAN